MSDDLYLDLMENEIYEWIKLVFKIDITYEEKDKLCLLYTDIINGAQTTCLLYLDTEYPPFDNSPIKIREKESFEKTRFLWSAILSRVKSFVYSISKTLNDEDSKFLQSLEIVNEIDCLNMAFCPTEKTFEFDRYPNNEIDTKKTQWYLKKLPRLSLNIEILKDYPPTITHSDLLESYLK